MTKSTSEWLTALDWSEPIELGTYPKVERGLLPAAQRGIVPLCGRGAQEAVTLRQVPARTSARGVRC